jgi:hypothetical protein
MRFRKPPESSDLSSQLFTVHRRLERWRQTRRQRCPIPETLWIASADLAREFGLSRTAKALRLDYYALKKRLDALVPPAPAESRFVELVPPSSVAAAECMVEMEHPGGAKMRIHLKGAGVPDWAALSQAFWGAAP